MDYILQLLIACYFCFLLVINGATNFIEVFTFLSLLALFILRYKYIKSYWLVYLQLAIVSIASYFHPAFVILFAIIIFELIQEKKYIGIVIISIAVFIIVDVKDIPNLLMIFIPCGLFAYSRELLQQKEDLYRSMFDKERAYRYELENARQKLLNFAKDSAHLAEIKERNRIARDIHDNLGHSIAGILMQLQAAYKISQKDYTKSTELLNKSIEELRNALTLLRNTVHNLKPNESLGIDYINEIINNYTFCKVNFTYVGNISELPANILEAVCRNIKEALTNTSKHSKATEITIDLQVTIKYVRLYIKDNGNGCESDMNFGSNKKGLGLSGMKERVEAFGGNLSISSDNGFQIVCFIPLR